jgi:hypothetical protein
VDEMLSARLKGRAQLRGIEHLQTIGKDEQRERERERIHTVEKAVVQRRGRAGSTRPAGLKPRRSFSYTKIMKIPVFDCAVALCTMQNALLVISNLT